MESKASTANEPSRAPIRLLLHAVDGAVPFLTPSLLKKYAPPSDHLWIGVAARDSCVVPIFRGDLDATNKSKKRKAPTSSSSDGTTKVCGYKFVAKPVDSVLEGYSRVLVPSFDLYQDVLDHCKRGKATISSTDKHVLVWTTYGRHQLSSEVYQDIAKHSSYRATLALYDMALDEDTKKQKAAANRRCIGWLNDMIGSAKTGTDGIWAPVVLTGDSSGAVLQHLCENFERVTGVAFVGFPDIASRQDRISRLETAIQKIQGRGISPNLILAILSTQSTRQILDAARLGINVIGTSLPQMWASSKRAFVCDIDLLGNELTAYKLDSDGCADLNDECFARDPSPLCRDCQCLACQDNKHSRAYIHHLVKSKELLAEILLFAHNLHHMIKLCSMLSTARNNVEKVCKHLESQLNEETQK